MVALSSDPLMNPLSESMAYLTVLHVVVDSLRDTRSVSADALRRRTEIANTMMSDAAKVRVTRAWLETFLLGIAPPRYFNFVRHARMDFQNSKNDSGGGRSAEATVLLRTTNQDSERGSNGCNWTSCPRTTLVVQLVRRTSISSIPVSIQSCGSMSTGTCSGVAHPELLLRWECRHVPHLNPKACIQYGKNNSCLGWNARSGTCGLSAGCHQRLARPAEERNRSPLADDGNFALALARSSRTPATSPKRRSTARSRLDMGASTTAGRSRAGPQTHHLQSVPARGACR